MCSPTLVLIFVTLLCIFETAKFSNVSRRLKIIDLSTNYFPQPKVTKKRISNSCPPIKTNFKSLESLGLEDQSHPPFLVHLPGSKGLWVRRLIEVSTGKLMDKKEKELREKLLREICERNIKFLTNPNKDQKTAKKILKLWSKKTVIEQNDLLKDEQHQMVISKAYKETYDSETENSETEDNKKQKEEKEGNPEKKRRKDEEEEEAEPTYDLTSLRDDKQLNLFFEEKYHRHWMGRCRPISLVYS